MRPKADEKRVVCAALARDATWEAARLHKNTYCFVQLLAVEAMEAFGMRLHVEPGLRHEATLNLLMEALVRLRRLFACSSPLSPHTNLSTEVYHGSTSPKV